MENDFLKDFNCLFDKKKFKNIDDWVNYHNEELKKEGYKKYSSSRLKSEDYSYIKTIYNGDEKAYQIVLLFYDYRQFNKDYIGISFECLIICNDRIDMSVSKKITLKEFEEMAEKFYINMSTFY